MTNLKPDNPTFLFQILMTGFTILLSFSSVIAQVSNIAIHVRGNTGDEDMTLTVNGQVLGSWVDIPADTLFQSYKIYNVVVNTPTTVNSLRINSTSGQVWEHALIVDKIVIDGVVYQSEANTTKGYTWDGYNGCTIDYKSIEWLSCPNSWFEYEAVQGVELANPTSNDCSTSGEPIIIFDTDIGPDIDDALALAMLHSYASNGEAKIAAVTVSRNSDIGVRYCDAINTFYMRPDIPIGKYFGSTTKDNADNAFTGPVIQSGHYPHDVHTTGSIKEGYKVMREVLASSPDNSVIILQTGFSTNTAQLLQSQPDAISPLTGQQLVQQKVSLICFMGGRIYQSLPEFNIQIHIPSAQYLFANCPVDIIQSDFALGYNIFYPLSSIYNDYNYVTNHPIKQSYLTTDLSWHQDNGAYYNMRVWDLTSVIAGIEPLTDYFKLEPRGNIVIQNNGVSVFTANPNGNVIGLGSAQSYSAAEKQKIVDRMILLSSQPPGLGNSCVSLQLKVCLEGAQNASIMTNNLYQRNLLPSGQPYNVPPWNYPGTEGGGWTVSDYPANAVDWVLISLRSTTDPVSEVAKGAALVLQDGRISITLNLPNSNVPNSFYVVVEHRNHLPVMTATSALVINNTITHDFTSNNSYLGGGLGQKLLDNTIWCLYAGDSTPSNTGYEISGADNVLWQGLNGNFQQYLPVDYDLDGDVNAADKVLWYRNNGVFSGVPK